MTEPFWEQIEARGLAEETVPLPLPGGGTVSLVLRALPPAQWDALCEAYPAAGADGEPAASGAIDTRAMCPALLAASVVAPDGTPPKNPAWWEQRQQTGGVTAGELDHLFDQAWALNRRSPASPDQGKD